MERIYTANIEKKDIINKIIAKQKSLVLNLNLKYRNLIV